MTSLADPARISVRGNASDEELAVVLAVVSSGPRPSGGYHRWRATRLAALRRARSELPERE
jgi:hypothetical protein